LRAKGGRRDREERTRMGEQRNEQKQEAERGRLKEKKRKGFGS